MKGVTCPKCGEYIITTHRKKELQACPIKPSRYPASLLRSGVKSI